MALNNFFSVRNFGILTITILLCALAGLKVYRYFFTPQTKIFQLAAKSVSQPKKNKISQGPSLHQLISFYNNSEGSDEIRMKECLKQLSPNTKISEDEGHTGFPGLVYHLSVGKGLIKKSKQKVPPPQSNGSAVHDSRRAVQG